MNADGNILRNTN